MIPAAIFDPPSAPTGLLVWCGIGFCAGIGLFFYGFRLLQRRRLILDTPFSKIRSASLGMVEVSGLAVGPYTMTAPITQRPCYYYRTVVWEYKTRGDSKQWVKVAGECMHVPFFVDDSTGRLLVDPRGADLDLYCDFKDEFYGSYFAKGDNAPENIGSFLLRYGIVTSNKLKIEEYCIKPKSSLFVLGTLAENPGLEVSPQPIQNPEGEDLISNGHFSLSINSSSLLSGLHGNRFAAGSSPLPLVTHSVTTVPQVIRRSAAAAASSAQSNQEQQVAAALLKAGISNPAAWKVAGMAPGIQVMTAPVNNASVGSNNASHTEPASAAGLDGFDVHPPVVLMKGTNNKAFLISWRSQQDLARSMGWKCTLMIWGGPALALLSLYFFLAIRSLF